MSVEIIFLINIFDRFVWKITAEFLGHLEHLYHECIYIFKMLKYFIPNMVDEYKEIFPLRVSAIMISFGVLY